MIEDSEFAQLALHEMELAFLGTSDPSAVVSQTDLQLALSGTPLFDDFLRAFAENCIADPKHSSFKNWQASHGHIHKKS